MENNLVKLVECVDRLYEEINNSVCTNSDKWKIINAIYQYLKYGSLPILSKRLYKIVGDMLELLYEIKTSLKIESKSEVVNQPMTENNVDKKNIYLKKSLVPSRLEVVEFIKENQLDVDAERFYHHYNAMGFKILGNPIHDWRSKAFEWDMRKKQKLEKQRKKEMALKEKQQAKINKSSTERKYSEEEIKNQNLFSDLDNIEV